MILNKESKKNISLRSLLEGEGYSFPCGGKGLCGKCRIVAPALPITDLDRRFLSETELSMGERLACNKVISEPLDVSECKLPKFTPKVAVKEGGITALLYPNRTEVTLTDMENETHVETLILPTADSRAELRSIVGKNSVELFEKYNLATAPTIILTGVKAKIATLLEKANLSDGSLNAVEYALPGDELYLAGISEKVTGTAVMEALDEPDGTLLIELSGETASAIFKNGAESQGATGTYEAVLTYAKATDATRIVIVGGDAGGAFVSAFPYAVIKSPKAPEVAVSAVTSLRKRSKIRNLSTSIK